MKIEIRLVKHKTQKKEKLKKEAKCLNQRLNF